MSDHTSQNGPPSSGKSGNAPAAGQGNSAGGTSGQSGQTGGDSTVAGFDTFDAFVKAAIKDYYETRWKTRKGNFIALVLASGQMMSIAKDQITGDDGIRKVAIGAAGMMALRLALSWALTGPLGILLTGLTAASLVAFFMKNQKEISAKVPRFRETLTATQQKFEEIQSGYRGNRYEARERNLMIDGLQKRFLADCDEI